MSTILFTVEGRQFYWEFHAFFFINMLRIVMSPIGILLAYGSDISLGKPICPSIHSEELNQYPLRVSIIIL